MIGPFPRKSVSFFSLNFQVKKKCDDERAKRDGLNAQLLCLVEQQRKYAATVKQLTAECQRNEALLRRHQLLQADLEPSE